MLCPECLEDIPENSETCPECGESLGVAQVSPSGTGIEPKVNETVEKTETGSSLQSPVEPTVTPKMDKESKAFQSDLESPGINKSKEVPFQDIKPKTSEQPRALNAEKKQTQRESPQPSVRQLAPKIIKTEPLIIQKDNEIGKWDKTDPKPPMEADISEEALNTEYTEIPDSPKASGLNPIILVSAILILLTGIWGSYFIKINVWDLENKKFFSKEVLQPIGEQSLGEEKSSPEVIGQDATNLKESKLSNSQPDKHSSTRPKPITHLYLKARYPEKYGILYEKVHEVYSKSAFDTLFSDQNLYELDDKHLKKIKSLASPLSIIKQKKAHKDWVPILVNDKTLAKGKLFFEKYKNALNQAYKNMGIEPNDIIAILNWESRLGERLGTYNILQIFIGQYFYIDELEQEHYENGAYDRENVMKREIALQRLEKIKRRALSNMSTLLIQAKNKHFDPREVKGSWAGAIGIPQFMPASMVYAKDGNGDNNIDLNNMEDAILSVANYLYKNHYKSKGTQYAIMRYNPEEMYVRGVTTYSQKVKALGVHSRTL